jgi:diguanylate cyclase (GGDEF)-like protein
MTTLLIASAAALATTILLVAGLLLARRSLARDLSAALERAERESRRAHVLGDLAVSLDLEEVIARTLEAARLLQGVEAASLRVVNGAAEIEAADGPAAETAGIVVPLVAGDESIGQLAAYSRGGALEAVRPDLEELARRAAPVIENARRFREARQLADLDALTGLHNQRFFHETLAREVARARRYARSLGLIVLDIDDFKLVNDRIGHLAGDAVLAETAERIRDAVRTADIACRVGGDEFAVILPEAGLVEADQLYDRISSAVSTQPIGQGGLIRLSAGVTELRPGDGAVSLFQRADEALYRAKGAGKATVVAVAALPPEELRARPEPASGSGEA